MRVATVYVAVGLLVVVSANIGKIGEGRPGGSAGVDETVANTTTTSKPTGTTTTKKPTKTTTQKTTPTKAPVTTTTADPSILGCNNPLRAFHTMLESVRAQMIQMVNRLGELMRGA
ncbi:unnamed protein product [Caenorhabditis auriculariae]|uniref:Uncharacterized protein n=1 Tax=Caenorhabditis auriculariae TaxID=2777116 RepID=A0A8S1HCK6_9PELO|nr:unnamed protein product [Caenorhabditis auriculariae]